MVGFEIEKKSHAERYLYMIIRGLVAKSDLWVFVEVIHTQKFMESSI
jgi:hypothetical protein